MEFSRVTLCVLFALVFMLSTTEAKKKCKQGEVRCFVNPCDGATCPGFEGAICKPNYCGGCNAEFFIEGAKVNCKRKGKRRMRCPKACGFNYEPVCGSDDKTYDNPCLFRKAKCENKELYLKKRMACDQCIKVCGFRKRPVCGSDGKTYDNFCLFRKARCENKDLNLKMAKPVACDMEYTCPRVCTLEYRPVCGSDGVLYDNRCKFQNARFCQKKDIRIVGKRRCSGNEEAEEP